MLLLWHRYMGILLQFRIILWHNVLIYHLMRCKIDNWTLVLRLSIWLILNVWMDSNWLPWILRICSIYSIGLTVVCMVYTVLWSISLRSFEIILSYSSVSTSIRSLPLSLSLLILSVVAIILVWCFFVFLMSFFSIISIILV